MRKVLPFLLCVLIFCTSCARADEIKPPNHTVENAAWHELQLLVPKLAFPNNGSGSNSDLHKISLSMAKLGRIYDALQVAEYLPAKSPFINPVANYYEQETRQETFRISVIRRANLGYIQDAKDATRELNKIENSKEKANIILIIAQAFIKSGKNADAQKVLFKVTPLAPKDFHVLLKTAYLFAKSGDIAVARRLFKRAKGVMMGTTKSERAKFNPTSHRGLVMSFGSYLIKSGLVDEFMQFYDSDHRIGKNFDARLPDLLLRLNHTDAALKMVRQSYPTVEKIAGLLFVAQRISSKNRTRSLSVMDEAVADFNKGQEKLRQHPNLATPPSLHESELPLLSAMIADEFHLLGKEKLGQNWLQKTIKNARPKEAALMRFRYAIYPLAAAYVFKGKRTFPSDQLRQINTQVQAYIPKIIDDATVQNSLQQLIELQIKNGQVKDATENIKLLEAEAKQEIDSAKQKQDSSTSSNLTLPLAVANFWKQIGEQQRCEDMLRILPIASSNYWSSPKLGRIDAIMQFGFVDEGLRLFHSLTAQQQDEMKKAIPNMASALAQAHPNKFPHELIKDLNPYQKLDFLRKFVDSLTSDIFQRQEL